MVEGGSALMAGQVGGWVEPGYEPVREAFRAGLADLGQGGGGFAAYVDGRLVADLWGGLAAPSRPWDEGTLAVLMSSTKGMVGLCAQMLADREQLDVNAPVATYWPEFAQRGKQAVLVRHLLTHTAGVVGFGEQRPPLGWDGVGWDDYDAIAAGLAAAPLCWEPGTRFGYHALTYGWLVGELVRRITGQTVGAMFASEVAAPLDADLHIGTPEPIQPRVAHIVDGVAASVALLFRPFLRSVQRQMADPRTLAGKAFLAHDGSCLMDHAESFFTQAPALCSEIPAGNGTGTARSLAKVYAALANGGELDGVRLVSEASVRSFRAEVIRLPDATLTELRVPVLRWLLSAPVRRSLGYLLNPAMRAERPRFGPNPAAFGHDGAGGQVGFADPDNRVAVGFVRNHLTSSNKFSARLIGAVYQAAGRMPTRTRRATRRTPLSPHT